MSEKDYDRPMHTAEHILNQTMIRMFNCGRAFQSHIEKKKSKCDYYVDHNLTEQEISAIEEKVNSIINQNIEVTEKNVSRQEAAKFLDLAKLPADAPDMLRVIYIGTYDACACIGPHVKNTSEIGTFKIISSDFNGGVLRLRFKLSQPGID